MGPLVGTMARKMYDVVRGLGKLLAKLDHQHKCHAPSCTRAGAPGCRRFVQRCTVAHAEGACIGIQASAQEHFCNTWCQRPLAYKLWGCFVLLKL